MILSKTANNQPIPPNIVFGKEPTMKDESVPTHQWTKTEIKQWLNKKHIKYVWFLSFFKWYLLIHIDNYKTIKGIS